MDHQKEVQCEFPTFHRPLSVLVAKWEPILSVDTSMKMEEDFCTTAEDDFWGVDDPDVPPEIDSPSVTSNGNENSDPKLKMVPQVKLQKLNNKQFVENSRAPVEENQLLEDDDEIMLELSSTEDNEETMTDDDLSSEVSEEEQEQNSKTNLVKCQFCPKTFKLQILLRSHTALHYPYTQPFQCSHCECRFYSESSLKSHLLEKHRLTGDNHELSSSPLQCPLCLSLFAAQTKLNEHTKKNHCRKDRRNMNIFCSVCPTKPSFLSSDEFKTHQETEQHLEAENDEDIRCNLCYVKAETVEELKVLHCSQLIRIA